MKIQISWLLKKPTDLDLHCLQRLDISGFSRTRVKPMAASIRLSLGTTEMAATVHKSFVCLFLTKTNMEMFTGLVLYILSLIKLIIEWI